MKSELEVKANKINYMRVMRKVNNQRQVLDVDDQVFEEVRMLIRRNILLLKKSGRELLLEINVVMVYYIFLSLEL